MKNHTLCRTIGLALSALLTASAFPARAQIAKVAVVQTLAEKKSGAAGTWQRAAAGTGLDTADQLRTGKRSKADVKFNDGSMVRLGQLSSLEIRGAKDAQLTGGQLLFIMLKPGRVLAGVAAAEIKGSAGIVAQRADGSSTFMLCAGAMDVVTPLNRLTLKAGQRATVRPDGTIIGPEPASPFPFEDGTLNPDLIAEPQHAPYAGSAQHRRDRLDPGRLAVSQVLIALGSKIKVDFNPFVTPVPTATAVPGPTPFATPPGPGPGPLPTPFPTLAPLAVRRRATLALQRSPVAAPPVNDVTPGAVAPSVVASSVVASNVVAPGAMVPVVVAITPVAEVATPAPEAATPEVASPETVAPLAEAATNDLSLDAARDHLKDVRYTLGSSVGGDFRVFGGVGDSGGWAVGARLEGIATRGQWYFNAALTPLRVRLSEAGADGDRTQDLTAIATANATYRDQRGDVQLGRQRFVSGPTQATLFGSLVRQGGREIMDAVRLAPNLGRNRTLEVAYLSDAYPRNLPYRIGGRQQGFYGRFAVQRPVANLGVNLLKYKDAPVADTVGASVDFAVPLARRRLELYGEVGRDPFKRRLTTVGLYFPDLYQRSGFDLYLEHARLHSSSSFAGPPNETALLVYRKLNEHLDLLAEYSRFSGSDSTLILGISAGGRAGLRNVP